MIGATAPDACNQLAWRSPLLDASYARTLSCYAIDCIRVGERESQGGASLTKAGYRGSRRGFCRSARLGFGAAFGDSGNGLAGANTRQRAVVFAQARGAHDQLRCDHDRLVALVANGAQEFFDE